MDDEGYDNRSEIGKLINKLEKLRKKPQLDNELSSALDIFRDKFTRQKAYLINGIFNINFAEAALFIQSCSELYSKKIDLLWDQFLELHTRLIQYDCDHQKKTGLSIDRDAVSKLEERRNRFKRKKNFKLLAAETESAPEAVNKTPVEDKVEDPQQPQEINVFEDILFREPSVIKEKLSPRRLYYKNWVALISSDFDRKYTPEDVGCSKNCPSSKKISLDNNLIAEYDNFEVYDMDDTEYNINYNDAPNCSSFTWIFQENDSGTLPDENHCIASLRLTCYLRSKFLRDNNIPYNKPYNEYKQKYLQFKRQFFKEEDERWQNMPIDTLADQRKRDDYMTKLFSPYHNTDEQVVELKQKAKSMIPYKDYHPINGKVFRTGVYRFLPYVQSDASILTLSDYHDEKDGTKSQLLVELEKLSDSIFDSGIFSIKEELDSDDRPKEMCELDKEGENNNKSMLDEAINRVDAQAIGENEKNVVIVIDDTKTEENSTKENVENGITECNALQSNQNPEKGDNTIEANTETGNTECTDTVKSTSDKNSENGNTNTENTEVAISNSPDNSENEDKTKNTETVNTQESNDHDAVDNFDVISIMSDHDYCALPPELSNVLKNSNKSNLQDATKSSETFVPMNTAAKIVPRNVRQIISKENKFKDPSMGPPPAKRRKLTHKQIEKLLTSKIKPVKEMKFEKFFSQNYHPGFDEGDIQEVEYESEEETPREVAKPVENHKNGNVQSKPSPQNLVDETKKTSNEKSNPTEIVYSDDDCYEDGFPGFARASDTRSSQRKRFEIDPEHQERYEKRVAEVKEQRRRVYEAMNIDPKDEVEKYLKHEKEQRESKKRVQEWTEFITPILEKTSEKDFDVHEYETRILDQMEVDESKQFKNMVEGKPSAEVIRFFVASLHLANTENIEISGSKSGQLSNETFTIKLLKRDRYHEHLAQYEAPSLENFRERIKRMREQQSVEVPVEQIQPAYKRQRIERKQKKRKKKFVVSSSDEEEDSGYQADSYQNVRSSRDFEDSGYQSNSYYSVRSSRNIAEVTHGSSQITTIADIHQTPVRSHPAKRSKGSASHTPNPIKGKSIPVRKSFSETSTFDIDAPSTSGTYWAPSPEPSETPVQEGFYSDVSQTQFHSTPLSSKRAIPSESTEPNDSGLFFDQ
ncbi:uncharacterized protein [Diabrotica undecimpunctata]|uniref:uncharacterized protein n=1 Tax=Diabrotica undecimpunctata TaxID=50387 RepID=UPI003B63B15C